MEWSSWLTSEKRLAASTVRGYQGSLRLFSEFLIDGRYGWATECEKAFGTHPVPICHEWNTIAHLNSYEGRPEARPSYRDELQRFFDYADDQVDRAQRSKRKGALAAYRDATLFKVIYGWGLSLGSTLSAAVCHSESRGHCAGQISAHAAVGVRVNTHCRVRVNVQSDRSRSEVCGLVGTLCVVAGSWL